MIISWLRKRLARRVEKQRRVSLIEELERELMAKWSTDEVVDLSEMVIGEVIIFDDAMREALRKDYALPWRERWDGTLS